MKQFFYQFLFSGSMVLLLHLSADAQKKKTSTTDKDQAMIINSLNNDYENYAAIARQIWGFAELGYQEQQSTTLLQSRLKEAGFSINAGVAGIPTAFVASYGQGRPVIAILGEFDALPGLSQEAIPERKPIAGQKAGHACGHHLFGTASVAAAITVKNWLQQNGHTGTIRLYGCPAEEGGSGKVYMVREGLFNDVDVVLHWHPADKNSANAATSLANKSAKFRFYGVAAHAAAAPERGRSALDAVESMDYMVNMMREHIPSDARIHYVITKGGEAPNVVPNFAEVYYYVRHPNRDVLLDIWDRLVKASQGAALGTGTRVDHEIIGGTYNLLPNITLARLMHQNLTKVGGYVLDEKERAFAEKISATLGNARKPLESTTEVQPFSETGSAGGSTDVGDVSWTVPTVGLNTATWVPGTAAHSWQAVAAGGTSIGAKGMLVAAKTIALTAVELYKNPALVMAAKKEFEEKRGANFKYEPLLGNRKPALDYRK